MSDSTYCHNGLCCVTETRNPFPELASWQDYYETVCVGTAHYVTFFDDQLIFLDTEDSFGDGHIAHLTLPQARQFLQYLVAAIEEAERDYPQ